MFKKFISFVSVCFVIAAGALAASAQWQNLGSKEVTDRAEQDTFHIGTTEGQFKKLKFRVSRRPIRFYRMEITYANGEKDKVELKSLIRSGGESRVIDIEGKDRFIRKVDFWYEASSIGRGRRATITLWGLK